MKLDHTPMKFSRTGGSTIYIVTTVFSNAINEASAHLYWITPEGNYLNSFAPVDRLFRDLKNGVLKKL